MKLTNTYIPMQKGDLQVTFLNSGDIFEVTHNETLINQLMANPIDGSLNNIYLRLHTTNEIQAFPLLGVASTSTFSQLENGMQWKGEAAGIAYTVTFQLATENMWFWNVELEGEGKEVDLVYGQDLGLADKGAVRSNEAYMSQYMDHKIFENHDGYTIATRQNQPMQSGFPYIQQGALGKTVGYSTDGFQFFGKSYRKTNQPEVLNKESLANEVYQYEFAYTALQSEKLQLHGQQQFVFYGLFQENQEAAVTEAVAESLVQQAWDNLEEAGQGTALPEVKKANKIGAPLAAEELTEAEIGSYYPERRLEEKSEAGLLSFFTPTHEHVVLQQKELAVERPHGHILMSGHNDVVKDTTITTNVYMYGLFNSQVSIGNTNMNKMLSNTRNPLNRMKTSGQRIYLEVDGEFRLLTMPSLFEIGFNYARWIYKLQDDVVTVTTFTMVDKAGVQLDVTSKQGKAYRFLVTNQATMQNNEYEVPYELVTDGNMLTFTASEEAGSKETYPDLTYTMQVMGTEIDVKDERVLAESVEPGSASLVVLELQPTSKWTMIISGDLYGEKRRPAPYLFTDVVKDYRSYYKEVMQGFHLEQENKQDVREIEKVNTLAWWYTHNMLVHFSVPHGLEQYGGAAWGTRDVSQGPAEYFMATQHYETVRDIIKTIFAHQYEDTGNWPQWFMFDKYNKIQQDDSHGDIIVWPMKVVCDYIEATGDTAILKEEIPYTDRNTYEFTEEKATLLDHLKKEMDYINAHFLHDTYLSAYDDGDWDDTLQPANQNLKKYMASSWTVALTYEALRKMTNVLKDVDEETANKTQELVEGIKRDFNDFLMQTDIIPGFVYMEEPGEVERMLHPTDEKTGINYRLLPMQQSIISELFTLQQAESHYDIIKKHLFFPDGVRLMNRPANYKGGVSTHFKRAEQASNFGREIGLQYVHAHIRYVEAMAKLGYGDETWDGLAVINPIAIQDVVPNAELRQSNAYFSSSDGDFKTRYEAQEQFGKLRDGSVKVKGGWRIYSSGPGIYMNQLIANTLGVRQFAGDLILDPVLPERLDGLRFTYTWNGKPVTFVYHLNAEKQQVLINGAISEATELINPYRAGGIRIPREQLDQALEADDNTIEVFV
ncbi:GH36-type glycosyl hydrolase domain-containing protein [Oceanobacillus picturae]|uniref:GH36-type glycosyl hydrolase domain-containing protein n=1 Tax=Oceanobacillus picturae TaxID=171693 RepID=UPI000E69B998|nr:cellobiose phosphorylase [Oceanobacillus picturae]RIU94865.1 cellobiose phosphorylase [Oceanobacillus picturae]